MKLSDVSIQRPVFATVMSLLLIVLGVMAYSRLTLRELPAIDPPIVSVDVSYPGASAAVVETRITQVLEDALSGIEGIETLQSRSVNGRSSVTLEFTLNREIEAAANDVRDAISGVADRMPDEADPPEVEKADSDSDTIIWLNMSSSTMDTLELSDYADRYIVDRLSSLDGVAQVRIGGRQRYAMRVWLDSAAMAARGITANDVESALRAENVELPAGRIESGTRDFTLRVERNYATPDDFARVPLREGADGYVVRLGDVAKVELASAERRAYYHSNGQPNIGLGIIKTSTANALDVTRAARAMAVEIQKTLPEGTDIFVAFDDTVFIEASIERVYATLLEAVALVLLVIWLFLGSFRAAMIPALTVPVCLLAAFIPLYLFGYSINLLTLLALVLSIGLVVDDAIVVLENIHRHIEEGQPPIRAAILGSREIAFAVVAMTVTLAAVYVPIGFMTGLTGRLFTEFALTLAGAVVVSGFVALTLSPMMSSRLLKHEPRHSRLYNAVERALNAMTAGYAWALRQSLRVRPVVIALALAVAAASYLLFTALPSELAPIEDRSTIIAFGIGPEGATVQNVHKYANRIEDIVKAVPEVDRYFVVSGFPVVSQMIAFVGLKPWEERTRKQQAIAKELAPKFFGVPGLLAFPINQPSFGQRATKPVQFVIQTSQSYAELQKMVDAMMAEARKNPNLQALDSDLKLSQPQISVTVDRAKVSDVGVPVDTVGRTMETMLGGRQVTRFKQEGKQYDVLVQVDKVERRNPRDVTNIFVRGKDGEMIQLSNLVKLEETVAPKELNRFNQLRAATISANLAPGYPLGEALTFLEETAARVLPAAAQIDYSGESREFKQSSAGMYVTFLLALGFIYLVLAAQFESFVDPFIIMLTVPLSLTGALLALYLTGQSLNVYSQIGLVTLVGLITKHGILIVEFANQIQRQDKKAKFEAVIEAAALRLRPILMTTGAMVLGTLPLALASGAGAESRQAIGWVIVGGLTLGTLLTLFVVPMAYTLLARDHTREEADHFAPSDEEVAAAKPA